MDNYPLVSVLMTSYNREKYIGQAIQSVLDSTYKNFELIIVDDCSSDSTVNIAQNFATIDKRVKVYKNEQNLGDYPNRNKAASYAKGKYLKYVDADDLIYPHGLEVMVSMMEQFPNAGYGLCSIKQNINYIFPILLAPVEAYKYHYLGPVGIFSRAPLSSIILKTAFEEVGGFTPIRMCGDFDMWHKLSKYFNVVLMPPGMIWYRVHDNQEMTSYQKYILEYEKVSEKHLFDRECPLSNRDIARILNSHNKTFLKQIIKSILRTNFIELQNNFRKFLFWRKVNKTQLKHAL